MRPAGVAAWRQQLVQREAAREAGEVRCDCTRAVTTTTAEAATESREEPDHGREDSGSLERLRADGLLLRKVKARGARPHSLHRGRQAEGTRRARPPRRAGGYPLLCRGTRPGRGEGV